MNALEAAAGVKNNQANHLILDGVNASMGARSKTDTSKLRLKESMNINCKDLTESKASAQILEPDPRHLINLKLVLGRKYNTIETDMKTALKTIPEILLIT